MWEDKIAYRILYKEFIKNTPSVYCYETGGKNCDKSVGRNNERAYIIYWGRKGTRVETIFFSIARGRETCENILVKLIIRIRESANQKQERALLTYCEFINIVILAIAISKINFTIKLKPTLKKDKMCNYIL